MREIIFNGKRSLADYHLTIAPYPDTRIGTSQPRTIRETVAYRNGSYDFSAMSGSLIYDDRTLVYTFNLHGESREDLETVRSEILAWLTSASAADLYDDDLPGWHFTNVTLTSLGDLEFISRIGRNAKLTATFQAAPYMVSNTGERIPLAILTPTSNSAKYVFAKIGGSNGSLSYAEPDLSSVGFDTFTLSADNLTATATVSTTDWSKMLVHLIGTYAKITVSASGGMVAPYQYDGNDFYGAVSASASMLTLKITFTSPINSAVGNIIRLGCSELIDCPLPPDTDSLKLTSEDSEPTVTINGAETPADNIAIPGGITVMTVGGCKDEKLTLLYDTIKRRL